MNIRLINNIIPKRTNQICINAFPDYDAQTKGLVEALNKRSTTYDIVILTKTTIIPDWAKQQNIRHIQKKSIQGVWSYLRSKYVFFTHGFLGNAKSQITINLWHGMPIKKIRCYLNGDKDSVISSYTVSTSPFFKNILSHAFSVPQSDILEVGLPRNDLLLKNSDSFIKEKLCGDMKMIVWLPTYRRTLDKNLGNDGEQEKNIFNMPDLEINALNNQFKKMGVVAVIKPHPISLLETGKKFTGTSNIKLLDEDWLTQNDITLYEILAQSDALITDVSSVLIDYLLVDRPIISHFPDADSYSGSRGLIWDFNPTDHGIPLVTTQDALLLEIEKVIDNADNFKGYTDLKNQMHTHTSNFSEKLLDKLDL